MPFLENIEKGIKNGITKVRVLGELSRLSGEIALREERREECLASMGERYYDSLKRGTVFDRTLLCRELECIDRELDHLREEVRRLKNIMICPVCGTRYTSLGAFCPVCGTERMRANVCPLCEAVLESDARYCVNCGMVRSGREEA